MKPLHRRACIIAVLLAGMSPTARAQQPEALWYLVKSDASIQSFLAHADQISVVAPQSYAMNKLGKISGDVDPRVIRAAHEHHVRVIPLVVNPGFDQSIVHRIVSVPSVTKRALRSLAALCRKGHYDGIQFDFEDINVADGPAFTKFVRVAADSVHRAGCTLSAAVVPRTSDSPGPTSFHKWIFKNWRGAYDYKALADALDFISYMTYAQHTGGTTPGPVAGYRWMEAALQFVLSLGVPPSKISLGIPSYSDWWYPTYSAKDGSRARGSDISYARAETLLARNHATRTWDDRDKVYYSFWDDDGTNEFLWEEEARAFTAKRALVTQYKLRGYSVWVLGTEDPAVWTAGAAH